VVSQQHRPVALLDAVDPAKCAARQGHVLALERIHSLILTDDRGFAGLFDR
jgi:hypothetical protein